MDLDFSHDEQNSMEWGKIQSAQDVSYENDVIHQGG
jgi:hypothetical protein